MTIRPLLIPSLLGIALLTGGCAPETSALPHAGSGIVLTSESNAARFTPAVLDGPQKGVVQAAGPVAAQWESRGNGTIHLSVFAPDAGTAKEWGTAVTRALAKSGVPAARIVATPMIGARQPAGVVAAWNATVAIPPACPEADDRFNPDIRCQINREIAMSASDPADLAGDDTLSARPGPASIVDVGTYQAGAGESKPGILKELGLSSTGGKL